MSGPGTTDRLDRDAVLAAAADYLWDVHELWEDEDLDRDDHLAVVLRGFTSGDCDAFAAVVSEMTGWPTVRATWTVRDDFGHHALVRSPDGRLFDAAGYADLPALRRRYRVRRIAFSDAPCLPTQLLDDPEVLRLIADVVRVLPHAPFDGPDLLALSSRRLPGEVDPDDVVPAPPGP